MSLSSLSLLVKTSIGIGIISLASSIPFLITNREEKQVPNAFTNNRLGEHKNEEVLAKISRKKCEVAYRNEAGSEIGTLYVCPFSTDRARQKPIDSSNEDVGELWYLRNDAASEALESKRDISELFKKVVSVTYKEGHISFTLDGESEERKFKVNAEDSWQYFSTSARFSEMETLLSSIYKKSL